MKKSDLGFINHRIRGFQGVIEGNLADIVDLTCLIRVEVILNHQSMLVEKQDVGSFHVLRCPKL